MKRVLYVDYDYQEGHVNFNHIQIKALQQSGYDVKVVTFKSVADALPFDSDTYALILPDRLKRSGCRTIRNRILFVMALIYIRWHLKVKSYDDIVVSYCDEISLATVPLARGMHIICHTAATLGNKVKRFFMKRLARHNSFIVFSTYMAEPFKAHGIENVRVVSHGSIAPFSPQAVPLPIDTAGFNRVIFHPSSKIEEAFVKTLTSHKPLLDYLHDNKILLILRNIPDKYAGCPNIQSINAYLSQDEYQQLFLKADIIMMVYPDTFNYQISGVSYECVANAKRMLIQSHPSLAYCGQYLNYNPFFSTIDEFCERVSFLCENAEAGYRITPESIQPDYKSILH